MPAYSKGMPVSTPASPFTLPGVDGITALGFQSSVFDSLSEIGAHEAAHVSVLTDVITQLRAPDAQD